MKSYFFIPASNKNFLNKIVSLAADYLILDLEDSVLPNDLQASIDNIRAIDTKEKCFVRIPWLADNVSFSLHVIEKLRSIGYHQFVFPKIQTKSELDSIVNAQPEIFNNQQILLIEHPKLLISIAEILDKFPFYGIALGSHDYVNEMQMRHTAENLLWAKHYILNYGKAYSMECIDIASMNVVNEGSFEEECQSAYDLGFEGKMLIHPMQLKILNTVKFYTKEDLQTALLIQKKIKEIGGINNFTVHKIDNKVIEKPHLKKYLDILEQEGYGSI